MCVKFISAFVLNGFMLYSLIELFHGCDFARCYVEELNTLSFSLKLRATGGSQKLLRIWIFFYRGSLQLEDNWCNQQLKAVKLQTNILNWQTFMQHMRRIYRILRFILFNYPSYKSKYQFNSVSKWCFASFRLVKLKRNEKQTKQATKSEMYLRSQIHYTDTGEVSSQCEDSQILWKCKD